MNNKKITASIFLSLITILLSSSVLAKPSEKNQRVIDYWTADRIASAIPRNMVIDKNNGLGYIMRPDGALIPHGHDRVTELSKLRGNVTKTPMAKPGSGESDSTPPAIAPIEPADGATIGASQRFAVEIIDASGVRSATLTIIYPNGQTQNFSLANSSGDTWENTLSGFTDGNWAWRVSATDGSKGKGNSATEGDWSFTVDTGSGGGTGGGGGGADAVANSGWSGGAVQNAAGRILFEMPTNARKKRWATYVCSGTVATDGTSGRSVIITAAHCIYDDANKAYARNVLFIPNQDQTTGSRSDGDCSNDPLGCWTPSFGVVDIDWTNRTFPNNIPWDYGYYVVNDSDSHSPGYNASSSVLDVAAGNLAVDFTQPVVDTGTDSNSADYTHGLGYSYSDDPNFMYCADNMTTNGADNWWIPVCGLSGGSSGGPWMQDSNGNGDVMSVNSWGYSDGSPGMAGPKLIGTSASCMFNRAKALAFADVPNSDGDEGFTISDCN